MVFKSSGRLVSTVVVPSRGLVLDKAHCIPLCRCAALEEVSFTVFGGGGPRFEGGNNQTICYVLYLSTIRVRCLALFLSHPTDDTLVMWRAAPKLLRNL